MIVTCASCLTKYHLDDSKVSEKGAKVRCSRCKHVFYLALPPETREEVAEDFESFAKYHEKLIGPDKKGISPAEEEKEVRQEEERREELKEEKREEIFEEEEEKYLFSEPALEEKSKSIPLRDSREENDLDYGPSQAKKRMGEKKGGRRKGGMPFRFLALLIIILILIIGLFYLWSEIESGGKFSHYVEYPVKKITQLYHKFLGTETQGLVFKDLTGYEEKTGEVSLFVIEGKVENQSQKAKQYIKVKVVIFDQRGVKVVEKEVTCGRTLDRAGLKTLPSDFFTGAMDIKPQTEKNAVASPGAAVPFMVIFRDLPPHAKEFKVDIIEAPSI